MYRQFFKRIFDVVLAAAALVVLAPLMLLVAVAIYLQDRQPILFKQQRIGRNGATFEFLKFRSMPINAANVPKTEAAMIQVTPVGKIIRRTNIDELPQLFNILKGDMSLVGPRPAIPAQTSLVKLRGETGALRCAPGLTGLAQVNAYDGMPETEKARFDGEYARKISLWTDAKIILRTFAYLTRKPPVY